MSPRINSPLALPPRIYCQVASVPFVLFGEISGFVDNCLQVAKLW